MRIAFFSEVGSSIGKYYPRNFQNTRTDVAWAIALNAANLSLDCNLSLNSQFQPREDGTQFDLGIIIVPKKNPMSAVQCYSANNWACIKWAVMQEGPSNYYQDWQIEEQFAYLHLLNTMDLILCHNELDKKYFKGLFPHQSVEILPSLMIEDAIPVNRLSPENQRRGCIIGGNFVAWYGGIDSFTIAQELPGPLYAPSMGRKQDAENLIEGITYFGYLPWAEWMVELSKRKYAVHLMRTFAAGTFALNCAYLGIPCIGYKGLDTQEKCFPELSVNVGDMESARRIAKHLANNDLFYNHVSSYAKRAWLENYSENVFLTTVKSYFKS